VILKIQALCEESKSVNTIKMKKIAAICLKMIFLLVLISCSKSSRQKNDESGTTSVPSSANKMIDPCPPGTHLVLTFGFDDFNFHRPVKFCLSGFWFCFINGHWYKDCVANSPYDLATFSVDQEYEVSTGITLKTGSYAVSDNGTELIVPVDLK